MPAIENALILGAGPAGLTAATSMARAGIQVTVAERALDLREIGSELMISSPNLRALDSVGLASAVAEAGVAMNSCEFHGAGGLLLASVPTPRVTRDQLPPSLGITRKAFYAALYDGAVEAGAAIEHDTTITSIEDSADGLLEVKLSNGKSQRVELLVGADGWNSTVRRMRFPTAAEPIYSGQCIWRARVPRRGDGSISIYSGQGISAGLMTVDDTHSYVFCVVNRPEPEVPDPARHDDAYYADRFRSILAEFDGDIGWSRDRLEPDTIHFAPLSAHIMAPPWHDERVILIGDAAHAVTPQIAYGAGLAVEDGITLGDCLAAATTLDKALEAFMSQRYDRCRMVVENGLQISRWQQGLDLENADQAGLTDQTWQVLATTT